MEQHSVCQATSSPKLPRFYQDYDIRCKINSFPLHGGMDHMIPTFLLTSTPQVMSMSRVTITSHLLHDPTSDPTGFSEDQASISPLTLVGKEKNFQSGLLETCQAGEQSSTYGQQVFRVPTPSRPANSIPQSSPPHPDTNAEDHI